MDGKGYVAATFTNERNTVQRKRRNHKFMYKILMSNINRNMCDPIRENQA